MPTKPKEVNQLNVVSFETNFQRMPATDFFCQRVNIPSLALGNAILPTQFSSVPVEGDTLVFENLTISFYVNEGEIFDTITTFYNTDFRLDSYLVEAGTFSKKDLK